jgi:hypothetical protein
MSRKSYDGLGHGPVKVDTALPFGVRPRQSRLDEDPATQPVEFLVRSTATLHFPNSPFGLRQWEVAASRTLCLAETGTPKIPQRFVWGPSSSHIRDMASTLTQLSFSAFGLQKKGFATIVRPASKVSLWAVIRVSNAGRQRGNGPSALPKGPLGLRIPVADCCFWQECGDDNAVDSGACIQGGAEHS